MSKRNLKDRIHTLLKKNHLLSVADILSSLEKENTSYNKTSVYRALEQMVDRGLICKHNFNKSETMYELHEDHHAHMVCKKCDSVFEANCDYRHPAVLNNFEVDHHHLTLIGTCADCITRYA